jgi:hypothetical protein
MMNPTAAKRLPPALRSATRTDQAAERMTAPHRISDGFMASRDAGRHRR